MALTNEEQRQLNDLERSLIEDDPALARRFRQHHRESAAPKRNQLFGVLTAIAGLTILIGALLAGGPWTVPAGVMGFIVSSLGAFWFVQAWHAPKKDGRATTQGPKAKKSFMQRMEDRWARRTNDRPDR